MYRAEYILGLLNPSAPLGFRQKDLQMVVNLVEDADAFADVLPVNLAGDYENGG